MATYRLLQGKHAEKDENGVMRKYEKGSYVVTDVNLEGRFGSQKFRKVSDDDLNEKAARKTDPTRPAREPKPINDGLEQMTIDQLRELAEDEEIDLTGARSKADIVKAIRESR